MQEHLGVIGAQAQRSGKALSLSAIARKPLKEVAVERIRAAIAAGELKPGDRITELGVAKSLGVGQPTIREALIELEHQGFVEKAGSRGTRVTVLTHRQITDIYAVRSRLEALVTELLIATRTPDVEDAEPNYRRMVKAAQAGDMGEYLNADLDFHRALWRAAGNETLFEVLEHLVPKLFAFGVIGRARQSTEQLLETAEEHRVLLELIRSASPEAIVLTQESMEKALREISELVSQNGG